MYEIKHNNGHVKETFQQLSCRGETLPELVEVREKVKHAVLQNVLLHYHCGCHQDDTVAVVGTKIQTVCSLDLV